MTFSLDDLRAVKYASAASFGLDTINSVLQADLAQYNAMVSESLAWLAEPVTEQQRVYGTSAQIDMFEIDEFGKPVGGKNIVGETVAFPIRNFASGWGFTDQSFKIATPAEIAERYLQVRRGHADRMVKEIQKAIFNDTNFTFVDPFNKVSLGVKRLINADSSKIPQFGGATFTGSTHTHYLAKAGSSLALTDITAAITHVREHGMSKGVRVLINASNKATVTALTGFVALSSAFIAYNATDSTIVKMDNSDLSNQMIGYISDCEVWVKPYVPANYILVAATEEAEKVLGYRQLPQAEMQGLQIAAPYSNFPLIAEHATATYGFGVWNRLGAACLYIGDTSWANPTIS